MSQPWASTYYGGEPQRGGNVPVAQLVSGPPQQSYHAQPMQQQQQQPQQPPQYQQQYQQPYQQPVNGANGSGGPGGAGGSAPGYSGHPTKPGPPYQLDGGYNDPSQSNVQLSKVGICRDWFFAALFLAHLVVWLGVGYWWYGKYSGNVANDNQPVITTPINLTGGGWGILGIAGGVALIMTFLFLYMVAHHARLLIWTALIFSVVANFAIAVFMLAIGQWAAGIVLILLAALNAFWIYLIRNRIQLTVVMVETISSVLQEHPLLVLVPVFWGLVSYGYLIIATLFLAAFTQGFEVENVSGAARGAAYFFLVLSLYWTVQVLAGIVYVTISGVVGTWYFLAPNNMPKHPILDATKRACINSFGSICIGSFIVAVVQTIRFFVQQAIRGENEIVQCIVMCLVNCLDSLVEYFNKYAFTQVALYGKTYLKAAGDAWQLLKARGFEAVINDNLTGTIVAFSGLIGAAVTGLIIAGFARFVIDDRDWGAWAGIGAAIGGSFIYTIGNILEGGVSTLFVCWAEDSEVLQQTKPYIFERLRQALEVAYGVRSARNAL